MTSAPFANFSIRDAPPCFQDPASFQIVPFPIVPILRPVLAKWRLAKRTLARRRRNRRTGRPRGVLGRTQRSRGESVERRRAGRARLHPSTPTWPSVSWTSIASSEERNWFCCDPRWELPRWCCPRRTSEVSWRIPCWRANHPPFPGGKAPAGSSSPGKTFGFSPGTKATASYSSGSTRGSLGNAVTKRRVFKCHKEAFGGSPISVRQYQFVLIMIKMFNTNLALPTIRVQLIDWWNSLRSIPSKKYPPFKTQTVRKGMEHFRGPS